MGRIRRIYEKHYWETWLKIQGEKQKEFEQRAVKLDMEWILFKAKQRQAELEKRYNHNHDSKGRFASKNSLTTADKRDTINSRGEVVALENQRYGRDKSTLVDKTYIESGEYRRKFDNITDNPEVNKALYQCAKEALYHRSGTKLEDMYWIDENGKTILSITDSTDTQEIAYTKSAKKAVQGRTDLVTIHTHPASMPPSADDLNSNCQNGYKLGVVACHNGKVFVYRSNEIVNEQLYEMYISQALTNGSDEFDAQLSALRELSRSYDIYIQEV